MHQFRDSLFLFALRGLASDRNTVSLSKNDRPVGWRAKMITGGGSNFSMVM